MTKFRRREDGQLILEEQTVDDLTRRWVRLEETAIKVGCFSPSSLREVDRLAEVVFEHAPYFLSLSDLDYDHQEVVFGFDLECRGNHDQLVAEALLGDHPFSAFLFGEEAVHPIECQPYLGIALTPDCDVQAFVEVKSRTTSYEVRTGEYESQPLSVLLTVRKYWGFGERYDLVGGYHLLRRYARDLAVRRVVPLLVKPLAQAIASQPGGA